MISSQLTQEAREDFNIVLKMAESIGLADHRPSTTPANSCISNTRSTRRRSGHHSDLFHLGRRERTNQVRERCSSQLATASHASHANSRKGSLNDVFHTAVKPYEDPVQYVQTQRLLIRNDLARLAKYSKNSERVQLISRDKQNRSKILG